jgi:hypothetical protein
VAKPTGPDWSEIRVTEIEDPLPDATFGSIGRYAEVARADGRDDPFIPQPLVLSFREGRVEHVDPSTLRIFEVDADSRSFALLENSSVDVEGGEVFGWVDHPGVYGVIGLPQNPAVLETLRLFQRFRPQLKEEADRGERGLQDRICGLILCQDPAVFGGRPGGPGDLCERCLGLDLSFGRLPEIFLLEPEPPPLTILPPKHWKPPKRGLPKILGWGYNWLGELGDGTTAPQGTPVWVPGREMKKIAGGSYTTCALATDGTVWWCGYNQLSLVQLTGLTNVVDIAAGADHGLAVRADGSVWIWGTDWSASYQVPFKLPGLSHAVAAAAGTHFSLVLTDDGRVWSWGNNQWGMLGDGSNMPRSTPALVPGVTQIRSVAAGLYSSFAVRSNGTIMAWGDVYQGVLAQGAGGSYSPVTIPGLSNVEEVSAGFHFMARTTAGEVWAWGDGHHGAVGPGAAGYQLTPVKVPGLPPIGDIAAGENHSLAMASDGSVWAWGMGDDGQIGDGAFSTRFSPVTAQLPPGAVASAVGAGYYDSFALVT